jgi:hypothetical protein
VSTEFSPNVGAVAADWDGDGLDEIVCGEWGPRLMYLRRSGPSLDDWTCLEVWTGLRNPHDVILADINADGRAEVIVREKDGRLLAFYVPADPTAGPWPCTEIASDLAGDGTACWQRADGAVDLVTNAGWFINADGRGGSWQRQELIPPELKWHGETRLAVADLNSDTCPEVVITESEIRPARMAILRRSGNQGPFRSEMIVERSDELGGLHSLQIADMMGDGKLRIITGEMENERTDGIKHRPRWWMFSPSQDGWKRQVLLDGNLGIHSAVVADFDGDGMLEIAGKVWRANAVNGNGGANHVDWLRH